MKKNWRIIIAIMIVAIMMFPLAACDNKQKNLTRGATNKSNNNSAGSSNDNKDNDAGKQEEITLTLWSIATESDAFHPAYKKAIEEFEASHPGIKIVHETFENESYKTKIKTAVAANDLPDIFFTWGGGFSEAFVKSGKVLPLDQYYTDEIAKELPKAALNNATYDGKLYGTTYTSPVSCLFYNKRMYDRFGLTPPQTWDELKNVCQTFLDNGITPFGLSVKDTWVLAMLHDALTLKAAGPEKTTAALRKQGQSYDDPDFLNAAAKLRELIDMGAIIKDAAGLSNDEASVLFYNGTVPMYVTGSWMAGSLQTDPENPEDFDVVPIPVLNDKNAKITDFMGGAGDTFMVAASTGNPDIAAEAAFAFTKSISKYAYLDGAGNPVWKIDYDDSTVNPITRKIADYTSKASSFTLWFDTLMTAEDAGEYLNLLQGLYGGNISPKEFTKRMANQLGVFSGLE